MPERTGGRYEIKNGKPQLVERTAPPADGAFSARNAKGHRVDRGDAIAAITAVLPRLDNKKDFNQDGTPKVAAVEQLLGRDVTDEAVEFAFQEWSAREKKE